jgi:hypothetical protein
MTWTHACCEMCWLEREGTWETIDPGVQVLTSVRRPSRVTEAPIEKCCFCDGPTISGIYVREDPATLTCTHADA